MIGGNKIEPAGFKVYVDHTLVHKLRILVDKGGPLPKSNRDVLDVLLLIEILLFAESIVLTSYDEDDPVEIETRRLIECLRDLRGDRGGVLVRLEPVSIEDQLKVACEAAKEFVGHLDFKGSFGNPNDQRLNDIDIVAGRPSKIQRPTSSFWETIYSKSMRSEDIIEYANEHVHSYGVDGFFAYGLANNDDVRDRIVSSYRSHGIWEFETWERMHVIYRAIYNHSMATKNNTIYAPGVVRSSVIELLHSMSLMHFRRRLETLITDHRSRFIGKEDWLKPYRQDYELPLPLIALAALPDDGTSTPLVERLAILRQNEGMVQIRQELASLDRSKNDSNTIRELGQLEKAVRANLGLVQPTTFPKIRCDSSSLWNTSISVLEKVPEAIRYFRSASLRKTPRAIFLSNLVQRSKETKSLDTAVEKIVGAR